MTEAESKMEDALGRCALLEKTKQRLQQDSEDLVLELERQDATQTRFTYF